MKLIALICILHRLMATPSSLVLKLRQFSKFTLSSKPFKLLIGFVGRFCQDRIACRPSSQSPILKASRVLQMCCKYKNERIGIAKILFLLEAACPFVHRCLVLQLGVVLSRNLLVNWRF